MKRSPPTHRHGAECYYFEAALTIATIPARIASGSSGQAATTAAKSGSV